MILLDVNVLVHAHREDTEHHETITDWRESALGEPGRVAVSDLALSGCLRIITHPRVFKEPTSVALALEFVQDLRSRAEVHRLAPGPLHWEIFTNLCEKVEARGNLVAGRFTGNAQRLDNGNSWPHTTPPGPAGYYRLRLQSGKP